MARSQRIGVLLAAGGARGPYEVGALSVLLPALERRGERPTIFVGASVGAINALGLAGLSHLAAEEAVARAIERSRQATVTNVLGSIWLRQLPRLAARYAAATLALPGGRLPSLFDPAPLRRHLPRWIDFEALHRNIRDRRVEAVGAAATAAASGRPTLFFQGEPPGEPPSRAIDYRAAALERDHVRASTAIPVLFPPVHVDRPAAARGWYLDGAARLRTPLELPLDLGADRVLAIATDRPVHRARPRRDTGPPNLGDGAVHVLEGMLTDPLHADLRRFGRINRSLAAGGDGSPEAVLDDRRRRGTRAYRRVPAMLIAPERPGEIADVASEVFRDRYAGVRGLRRAAGMKLLDRVTGGESPLHSVLLSYLFFDRAFVDALIELGRRDARDWLDSHPDPWLLDPLRGG